MASYTFWLGQEGEEMQEKRDIAQKIAGMLADADAQMASILWKTEMPPMRWRNLDPERDPPWAWIMGRHH